MANESVGDKLEKSYGQIKGGLKNIARKVTEEDTDPRIGVTPGPSKMTKEELAEAVRGR